MTLTTKLKGVCSCKWPWLHGVPFKQWSSCKWPWQHVAGDTWLKWHMFCAAFLQLIHSYVYHSMSMPHGHEACSPRAFPIQSIPSKELIYLDIRDLPEHTWSTGTRTCMPYPKLCFQEQKSSKSGAWHDFLQERRSWCIPTVHDIAWATENHGLQQTS